jgi:hypothetical protein
VAVGLRFGGFFCITSRYMAALQKNTPDGVGRPAIQQLNNTNYEKTKPKQVNTLPR